MSISSLRFRSSVYETKPQETKSGAYIYAGEASGFHEWELRARMRLAGIKEEDLGPVSNKLVEGLRGDAFSAAMEILKKVKGMESLIELIRSRAFPL
jgi:hypothetical protein